MICRKTFDASSFKVYHNLDEDSILLVSLPPISVTVVASPSIGGLAVWASIVVVALAI